MKTEGPETKIDWGFQLSLLQIKSRDNSSETANFFSSKLQYYWLIILWHLKTCSRYTALLKLHLLSSLPNVQHLCKIQIILNECDNSIFFSSKTIFISIVRGTLLTETSKGSKLTQTLMKTENLETSKNLPRHYISISSGKATRHASKTLNFS